MTGTPRFDAGLRFPRGLYGVTPDWEDTRVLVDRIERAAAHGLRALQLRRKNAQADALRNQAREIQAVCRHHGVVFVINDDWRLAAEIGADAVHVGREDTSLAAVRAEVGNTLLIGVSCYNDLALAQDALQENADYIAFGAVFPSPTKPAAARADLALLARARALLDTQPRPRPALVAIGGITPENCAPLAQVGVDAIALITGLFEAPDIAAAAAACARHY